MVTRAYNLILQEGKAARLSLRPVWATELRPHLRKDKGVGIHFVLSLYKVIENSP